MNDLLRRAIVFGKRNGADDPKTTAPVCSRTESGASRHSTHHQHANAAARNGTAPS